jgi:hypothetical protein
VLQRYVNCAELANGALNVLYAALHYFECQFLAALWVDRPIYRYDRIAVRAAWSAQHDDGGVARVAGPVDIPVLDIEAHEQLGSSRSRDMKKRLAKMASLAS